MSSQTKQELISILHTFIAVLGSIVVANISIINLGNITKASLMAFVVAVVRSVVKTMWNTYAPQINTVVNASVENPSIQTPVLG